MAQNGEIAERWGVHWLCHLQMLHLRISKRFVNLVNGPAGYPSIIEQFEYRKIQGPDGLRTGRVAGDGQPAQLELHGWSCSAGAARGD